MKGLGGKTSLQLTLGLGLVSISTWADTPLAAEIRELEYACIGERSLKLDLLVPSVKPQSPLMVWVHGGAWRSRSRKDVPIMTLVNGGYAVASVDYRLSTEAKFPAQIHDIKAAIRF